VVACPEGKLAQFEGGVVRGARLQKLQLNI